MSTRLQRMARARVSIIFCVDTSRFFNQMMATTAGFPSGGVDFEIVQDIISIREPKLQFPVQIRFPPTSKEGSWNFSLRLECYVKAVACGIAEANVTVHSSSGCKFVLSVFLHCMRYVAYMYIPPSTICYMLHSNQVSMLG